MPRLIIIVLIAGVGARAVTVPDQGSAAAAVDLENEQRHDVFDDTLDHATMAERAAGLRAEFELMKEVFEEQKSVIDSLESTAAEEVSTTEYSLLFRADILKENYQDYATDPAAKAAITDALVAAGVAVPGGVISVAWNKESATWWGHGSPPRVAAVVRLRVPLSTVSPSDRSDLSLTIARRVYAAVGTPRATPLGDALADVRVHRPSTPAATLSALAAALDYDYYQLRPTERRPAKARANPTERFVAWRPPPYALPDSYPRWFKVLYRQPWILWYQLRKRVLKLRTLGGYERPGVMPSGGPYEHATYMVALPWVVLAVVGFAVGRATAGRKRADEARAPDSLAALAREHHGDLAEKGMSPFVTPRGRGAGAVRLAAMPMPSPASVAEQDY